MLQQEIMGATRHRMLREICEALETIASERLLLLVFEDLHWVDHSTSISSLHWPPPAVSQTDAYRHIPRCGSRAL